MAEISDIETTFLDTVVYKGKRFHDQSILDIKTHFKPTETFQYTHFSSSHPPGVKKGFVMGEALRLLRSNSSNITFEENNTKFKSRLLARGYPKSLIKTLLSDIKFTERESALKQKSESHKEILPFVTQYHPSVPKRKQIFMQKWHLIQNKPSLRQIYKEPPNYILQKRQISQRYAQERNYREKTHKHGTYVSIVLGVVLACHSLLHPIQMYGQSSKD